MFVALMTTIQAPTALARRLADKVVEADGKLVVAGDRKGPDSYDLPNTEFLSLGDQKRMSFALADLLPQDDYCRKNLAYLRAIELGADVIYETDDDNGPNEHWVGVRGLETQAQAVEKRKWINVFRIFNPDEPLWPRGFPLDRIRDESTWAHDPSTAVETFAAPIQQSMHDGSPDADAIWRLVMDRPVTYQRKPSLRLPPGSWAPFNSQSTWWFPQCYGMLYMPTMAYCPRRMPDIYRGWVAQRCLWELGHGLVFHASEVIQERNEHNLLVDFRDEVGGYLNVDRLIGELEDLQLASGEAAVLDNVRLCYERLCEKGLIDEAELPLVHAWLEDIAKLTA